MTRKKSGSAKKRPKNSTNGRIIRWRLRFVRTTVQRLSRLSPELAAVLGVRTFLKPVRYVAPEVETAALAAGRFFEVRCRDVSGQRQRLATWTFGEQGPAVLLVHGWSGRGGQMHPFIAPLLERGLRVIVFDAPGHGRSTGKETSLMDFALAIRAIDRQIGPVRALVGHSMGGSAAALAALEALSPGNHVARLVTIGSPCTSVGALERFGSALGIAPEIVQRMRKRLEHRYGRSMDELDLRREGKRPRLLVVHDRGDREVPFTEAVDLATAWEGARFVATEGLGHRRILKDHTVIDETVTFVASGLAQEIHSSRQGLAPAEPYPGYELIQSSR